VSIGLIGQAIGLFALTNVDDLVVLALFFSQVSGRSGVLRVVAGQYLGFGGILAAAIAGTLGTALLPRTVIPYLGLLPLALGLRAAWMVWHQHRARSNDSRDQPKHSPDTTTVSDDPGPAPGVFTVAAVTLANGGDNIGVYVPVFTNTGTARVLIYVLVFLALVAVWCAAGHVLARRPIIARTLSRRSHILLPIVLIGIGLRILIKGHAFGL
jgi:cadmium resistance protein CadD (predicted permease)